MSHEGENKEKLGFLSKYMTVWVFVTMLAGVLIGYYVPGVKDKLGSSKIANVSVPMTVGLLWMMYPILCNVRYEILHKMASTRTFWKNIAFSLVVNWIIAPAIMLALGWATLPDLPEYRSGLMLVGTARCIAMVLIWNRMAGGDEELCAIIVAVNSLLQLVLYGPLSYVYVVVFSKGTSMGINMWPVVQSVLIFLGIPLAAAVLTRLILRRISPSFYDEKFMPFISPTSFLALLFVIIVIFASQGHDIVVNIKTLIRVIVPLILYFTIMFFTVLYVCYYYYVPYKTTSVHSFTAASNNFELAIAVAAGVYGETSNEAMAATIGPLVEVPLLLLFVRVLLYVKSRWYDNRIKA
ncbi:Arsenical-resistance protein Acr3 [Zancudomyces culisetae]|uniref:Arsenical-resistance protein Acr3 n=1 Tax=Zancudomyces culisetae TaxID=1213189 RepID=A0A1R1PRS2_ZANCU|nr:Arsenical-resistance protein Acr3 [Zancudomyces culisetae]|eukprot:OMH83651.1 Arsenical-resistance protein Acr3 [Zancudomyces culisetae]